MIKQASFFLCFCALGILTSCNAPLRPEPDPAGQDLSIQYQTVSAILTLTERAAVSPTPARRQPAGNGQQPTGTATETPAPRPSTERPSASLTPTGTPLPTERQQLLAPCDLAQPGRPIDITIPDDTRFAPGESFSKTWRLVNAGVCPWTRDYALVWFSGDEMDANLVQPFSAEVLPGQVIDVTVDMVAPQYGGNYQSNWKLRNQQGALFGIGPGGRSPFWVRIVVVPLDTATVIAPTLTLTLPPTTTPAAFSSGTVTLLADNALDLDSGELDMQGKTDLVYQDAQALLSPLNGARVTDVGFAMPGFDACHTAVLKDSALALEQLLPGTYLCYQTGDGLPGRALLVSADLEKKQLVIDFLTWLAH